MLAAKQRLASPHHHFCCASVSVRCHTVLTALSPVGALKNLHHVVLELAHAAPHRFGDGLVAHGGGCFRGGGRFRGGASELLCSESRSGSGSGFRLCVGVREGGGPFVQADACWAASGPPPGEHALCERGGLGSGCRSFGPRG